MLPEIEQVAQEEYLPNPVNLGKCIDRGDSDDGFGDMSYLMGRRGCILPEQYPINESNYHYGLMDGGHLYLMAHIIKNDYQFILRDPFIECRLNKKLTNFFVYITKHLNRRALIKLIESSRSKRVYQAALAQLKWLGENHIEFDRE